MSDALEATRRLNWQSLCVCLIVALIIAGRWQACHGVDFIPLYAGSRAMLEGQAMYAPGVTRATLLRTVPAALLTPTYLRYNALDIDAYPPSNALFVLPFAAFPFVVARTLLYITLSAIMHFGLWRLMTCFAPKWNAVLKLTVLFLAQQAITNVWALAMLQMTPGLLGMFALLLVALRQNRPAMALGVTALACCVKPTLAVPFLLMLVLVGQFRTAFLSVVITLAVNIAGFWRVGGWGAFRQYQAQIAIWSRLPANAPNPYAPLSLERIDWDYLLNGLYLSPTRMHQVSLLLSAAALAMLLYLAYRYRERRHTPDFLAAFAAPVVCLSLLCMYHHKYDAALLIAPLLFYAMIPPAPAARIAVRTFQALAFGYAVLFPFYRPLSVPLGHAAGIAPLLVERLTGCVMLSCAFLAALMVVIKIRDETNGVETPS